MKNKLQLCIAAVGSAIILTVAGVVFYQMYNTHLENEQIIDDCFKYFGEEDVVIMKEGNTSSVRCVNSEK